MLTDREAIVDALYRFGAGVDTSDMNLLETAFTDDAIVDFSPCGRKMGLDFPVLTGPRRSSTSWAQARKLRSPVT